MHRPCSPDGMVQLPRPVLFHFRNSDRCRKRVLSQHWYPGKTRTNNWAIPNITGSLVQPIKPTMRICLYGWHKLPHTRISSPVTPPHQTGPTCTQWNLPNHCRRTERLRKPKEGSHRGWGLGCYQRNIGIDNKHSKCNLIPLLKTTGISVATTNPPLHSWWCPIKTRTDYLETSIHAPHHPRGHWPRLPYTDGISKGKQENSIHIQCISPGHCTLEYILRKDEDTPDKFRRDSPAAPNGSSIHKCVRTKGGGVWLYPNHNGSNFVWYMEWPADIQENLVSFDNPTGGIPNQDLELAALVPQEATFSEVCKKSAWQAHLTCSDNTLTVTWTFMEVATINPVVANLLRIRSIVNTNVALTPTVFYRPGNLDTMAYDASHRFDLPHTKFLSLFSRKYHPQQSPSSWISYHLNHSTTWF